MTVEYGDLEHHGVKGMHWGQRKSPHQLNQESRQRDKIKRDSEIAAARARFKGGKGSQARSDLRSAKAQFHQDKLTMGSREARKILNETKFKNMRDAQIANQTKSGKETTAFVLGTIGVVALGALFGALNAKHSDILDDEEELYDFLEHHGVKGMRWGQRRRARLKAARAARTPQQRKSDLHRAEGATAIGAAVTVLILRKTLNIPIALAVGLGGVAASNALIKKHQHKKLSEL
jgi:hypothetical protein